MSVIMQEAKMLSLKDKLFGEKMITEGGDEVNVHVRSKRGHPARKVVKKEEPKDEK